MFTPELLIEAPRRSGAKPNRLGTHALYSVSSYSIETKTETKETRVLDLATSKSTLFTDSPISDIQWLVGTQVLWIKTAEAKTQFWISNAVGEKDSYLAGTVAAPIENVKVKVLADCVAVGFTALTKDGKPFDGKEEAASSAREYETPLVRFWDEYCGTESSTLWYTSLKATNGKYKLGEVFDALEGTDIEFPAMPDVIGGGDPYDMGPRGIIIAPAQPSGIMFQQRLYFIRCSFDEQPAAPVEITTKDWTGDVTTVSFSPDGESAVYAIAKSREAMNRKTLFVVDVKSLTPAEVRIVKDGEFWDREPESVSWFGRSLLVIAEDDARVKVYKVPATPGNVLATCISSTGSASSIYELPDGYLINGSTTIDSSTYQIVDATGSVRQTLSQTDNGKKFGLKPTQVCEFYYKSEGRTLHAWVIRPSFFEAGKKYPTAFVIHGGPKGAWTDSWSTRWNPALFAEQGYVVVAPNPSGSSGWGEKLCDAVNGSWGGNTYRDLVNCWDEVKKIEWADTTNAVVLGASFGGYMMMWLAGQPLANEFKALVCHDGILNMSAMMGCDVPFSLEQDMGSKLGENQEQWDQYDPVRYVKNWKIPMLIIHSDKDYRCPMVDGLAAYMICLEKKIPARFLNFPDENHWVLKHQNSLHWHHTVMGWINKWTNTKGISLQPPVTDRNRRRYRQGRAI